MPAAFGKQKSAIVLPSWRGGGMRLIRRYLPFKVSTRNSFAAARERSTSIRPASVGDRSDDEGKGTMDMVMPHLLTGKQAQRRKNRHCSDESWKDMDLSPESLEGMTTEEGHPSELNSSAEHVVRTPSVSDGTGTSCADLVLPLALQEALAASCEVRQWHQGAFEFIKPMEQASRNYGVVEMMRRLEDGCMVAVKRMPTQWVTGSMAEFRRSYPNSSECPWLDVAIVSHLQRNGCPYVCEFKGVFTSGTSTLFVSELATKGDLLSWCQGNLAVGSSRERKMRPLAVQAFGAVKWLHQFGIVHRDISLENIVVGADGTIKLIDFGMAEFQRTCTGVRGKKIYQAPEMHRGSYDAFATDVFALGVVLFGMVAQDYPWAHTSMRKACKRFLCAWQYGLRTLFEKVVILNNQGRRERLCELLSQDLMELLEGTLHFVPEERWHLGPVAAAASCPTRSPPAVSLPGSTTATGEDCGRLSRALAANSAGVAHTKRRDEDGSRSVWASLWLDTRLA